MGTKDFKTTISGTACLKTREAPQAADSMAYFSALYCFIVGWGYLLKTSLCMKVSWALVGRPETFLANEVPFFLVRCSLLFWSMRNCLILKEKCKPVAQLKLSLLFLIVQDSDPSSLSSILVPGILAHQIWLFWLMVWGVGGLCL